MLSTNNTFGASNFADEAETRRHEKRKKRGEIKWKTFSILVIAILFASIELNQNKMYCYRNIFKVSQLSLSGENLKRFARKNGKKNP